ncbi:hypothetical protein [Peterkaempfera bronchialis]|uniref:hypothetical protein n=1 Tax=Peterkaempfera bronchialis TaxID=2126346 RepID=UPI003C2E2C00
MLTDRSLRASDDLVVEVGDPGRRPLWQAVVSRHTPQEFLAPLTETLARQLRDSPDAAFDYGPTRAAPQTAWAPAEGWTVEVDLPGAQLHAAPTGLCGFAALDPGREDGRAGYWFFGGSGAHQWLITLSAAAPPAIVRQLYVDVADPAPVRRAQRDLPFSHLRHLTITGWGRTSARRLPVPAGLAATIAEVAQRSGPARPLLPGTAPASAALAPARRR